VTCKTCNAPSATELCTKCAEKLGITDGPAVRPAMPCARCGHPELIRALARELTIESGGEYNWQQTTPMAATYEPVVAWSLWNGRPRGVSGTEPAKPFGILEMYVCARCGFTEWYCRDPKRIPIGPEYGTERVSSDTGEPYR